MSDQQTPQGSPINPNPQPQYQQPQYQQPQPPPQGQYPPQFKPPGDSQATAALVCGIIGLFVCGIILGIVAIVQSKKATALGFIGGKAKAGLILGIIDIAAFVLIIILYVTIFAGLAASGNLSYY
jgi:hypothetical protein